VLAELLLRPFELMLDRGLAHSTSAQGLARELEGRVLALTVEGTPLDLHLRVAGGRIAVTLADATAPDAAISGTPLALGRLLGQDPQAAVRDGAVRLTGDTDIADRFRALLGFAAPDLEEALARYVGDPVAHQAGNAARALGAWSRTAAQSLARSTAEYLQEESGTLPTRGEVEELATRVDALVNDVDRAEARLRLLEERLARPASS
jgi:ubiquinone biosynthesis protein UbiJ